MSNRGNGGVSITSSELVSIVGARELAGRRRVFAGIGIPTLAVSLAQRTGSPEIGIVYESGVCGAHPPRLPETIGDASLTTGAEAVLTLPALFGYVLQGGYLDVGFLGAAQIDPEGSLNSTVIGDWARPKTRLPGSGGAAEVMANCQEVFVVMRRHDPRTFVPRLDFCTTPSPRRAARMRPEVPVPGNGVTTVITDLGILRTGQSGELELAAVHPGVDVERVVESTGWPLRVRDDVSTTSPPEDEELRLLRDEIDPERVYLR